MRRVALAALAALALGIALAGCSNLPASPRAVEEAWTGRTSAEDLLSYLAGLRGLGEAQLASEAVRQRARAAGDHGDHARVKAALALSLAPHPDDEAIAALVEPVSGHRDSPSEVRAMASFLHTMAGQRRRLRESTAAAGTRLREERQSHEQERQRAQALQERAAQLQQKLDALSEIEKSLSNRRIQGR